MTPDELERDVMEIREELAVVKATHNTVRLSGSVAAVVWSIGAGLVMVAFFIAQLASAQASMANTIATLEKNFHDHEQSPGHPVEAVQIQQLKEEVARLRAGRSR